MTIAQIIGLIVVLVVAGLCGYFITKKSQKNDLVKWTILIACLAIAMTWIFASGVFNGTEYVEYGMNSQGITDIVNLIYYAIGFASDKIIFLLSLGAFYAILCRCKGYKKLVNKLAEKLKGKEFVFALITSLLFAAMGSLLTQNFAALIFVPFFVSILLAMKLDKITAFAVTFGSIVIGLMGITYGGDTWFTHYSNIDFTSGMLYRLIVLVIAFILYNFFTIMHIKKTLKDKKLNEVDSDPFKVVEYDKKAKTWPISIILGLVFILVILGYVSWEAQFKITIFSDFHNWLIGLKIGDFEIFKTLLGSLALESTKGAFGYWTLFHGSAMLLVFSILVAIMSGLKLNDIIDAYGEGFKKLSKSALLITGAFTIMLAGYMCTYLPTITNTIFDGVKTFNPYLVSLDALISNAVNIDFGLSGYLVGAYFTSVYTTSSEIIHVIFTTLYGFTGLFVPTSAFLLVGLSYLDIDYKTWFKYIWMFIVGILVILLILFTIMTYI